MKTEDKLELFKKLEDQIVDELSKALDIGREHQKLHDLLRSLDISQEQIGILDYALKGPN